MSGHDSQDTGAPAPAQARATPAPRPTDNGAARPSWSVRRPMTLGVLALVVLILGFGGWAMTTTLAGAIIASGQIEVERNRQAVQHPEGGQVAELRVSEGDRVEAGDVILRFDDAALLSTLSVARARLAELHTRRARLEAERDDAEVLRFPDALRLAADINPNIAALMEDESRLFTARIETQTAELRQMSRRMTQIEAQIAGLDAGRAALEEQLTIVTEDLTRRVDLLDRGIGLSDPVTEMQRESAQLRGRLAEIAASRAETEERLVELELAILQRDIARREAAITELGEIRVAEQELNEHITELERRLAGLELRAPVTGRIFGLRVFGPTSVLLAAEPVAYIVPEGRPLVISTQVPAIHRDQIFVGQDVSLRFPAFEQRTMPEVSGQVAQISADVFTDEVSGRDFYRADVVMPEGQISLLGERELVPGMPVDALLRTSDRTPMEYLLEPLLIYFGDALREN